jgi:hypothetical protein
VLVSVSEVVGTVEFEASLFRWNDGRDAPVALLRVAGDGAPWNALLTSPLGKSRMVDTWRERVATHGLE